MHHRNVKCLVAVALSLALEVSADEWPRYMGAQADGISAEKDLKLWTGATPKVLWQKALGFGCTGVSVSKGRLYTMGNANAMDTVFCLEPETGKELWKFSYPCPLDPNFFEGGTRATPTIDGDRVYSLSQKGYLVCSDTATGRKIWSVNYSDLGGRAPEWGFAAAPTVLEDKLLIELGASNGSTAALDKNTGALVWKSGNDAIAYVSPILRTIDGKKTVIATKARVVVGMDPQNGKELWRFEFGGNGISVAEPVLVDANRLFVSTAYGGGCILTEIRDGKVSTIWRNRVLSTHVNYPVLWNGHIFGCTGMAGDRNASLICMDAATGVLAWSYPGTGAGSVLLAGSKLILMTEQSQLNIGELSTTAYKPEAQAKVFGSDKHTYCAPVLANGLLYCRNNVGDMVCIDIR